MNTIYLPSWAEARRRAQAMEPSMGLPLLAALDHVEAAWEYIRKLQHWYEDNRDRARGDDEYGQLLNFIEGDLVDLFRMVAQGVAELVPGYDNWQDTADPGDLDGYLDTFCRYLVLFTLAVEQAAGAEPLRPMARETARGLAGWCTELAVLIATIDTTVLRPLLAATGDDDA